MRKYFYLGSIQNPQVIVNKTLLSVYLFSLAFTVGFIALIKNVILEIFSPAMYHQDVRQTLLE